MNSEQIRQKFLKFFTEHGHLAIKSSSLIPDDPSVLLTTAGMQQFKRYYTGELDAIQDFGTKNTASIQKSFRTSDIDEVGDESHLTFFEMLGNFSFGGYFKKESVEYGYKFITSKEWMGLEIDKVTVFDPDKVSSDDWRKGVPFDKESYEIWKKILPEEKVFREGVDNFWGPTGAEGPCGPTTEIYVKNKEGKSIEIWNIVFNEYYCESSRQLKKLKISGVDTGMGLERLAMVSQGVKTIFETDLFAPLMNWLDSLLSHAIADGKERVKRILADHLRASIFLIADGVRPSNKGAGYILRRLLRRILAYRMKYDIHADLFPEAVEMVQKQFGNVYAELKNTKQILMVLEEEKEKFQEAIGRGIAEIEKLASQRKEIDGKNAFYLYESFGLPLEVVLELAPKELTKHLNKADFDKEFEKHQEISRAGMEKKFGGHGLLLDTGEIKAGNEEEFQKALRLHTATHLLHWALREVLGKEVHQMGSDITPERSRFDFAFGRKVTPDEIKKIEQMINEKIKEDLPVHFEEMPKAEAEQSGALHFFKLKYPEEVKVYYIGKDLGEAVSKEFCGGPHVAHTGEIGEVKVLKEEAVSAGVRRIRIGIDR